MATALLLTTLLFSHVSGRFKPPVFTNPPQGYTPIWPAQSKQKLAWHTYIWAYSIFMIQDDVVPEEDAMQYMIYNTQNGSGFSTYDWTVDVPIENLVLSPAFHLEFYEADSSTQRSFLVGYFNVSDPNAAQIASDAPTSVLSLSASPTSVTDLPPVPESTTAWSSTTEWATSSSIAWAPSFGTTASDTRTEPSSPASSSSSAVSLIPQQQTSAITNKGLTSSPTTATTTQEVRDAAATGGRDASVQAPRKNDLGIWIGIGVGLGVPLMALAVGGLLRSVHGRGSSGLPA